MAGGLQKKKREGEMKMAKAPKGKALPGKKKKRAASVPPIKGYK
jgi:hypothetical protein